MEYKTQCELAETILNRGKEYIVAKGKTIPAQLIIEGRMVDEQDRYADFKPGDVLVYQGTAAQLGIIHVSVLPYSLLFSYVNREGEQSFESTIEYFNVSCGAVNSGFLEEASK